MTDETDITKKVLFLMVSGVSKDDLKKVCIEKLDINPEDVDNIILDAEKKLTLVADYNRNKELGTAITRMNDIYRQATKQEDIKTALMAQREISKLMNLYGEVVILNTEENNSQASQELQAIAEHLLPLELADKHYPLREHARIASERIRERVSVDED